MNKISIFGVAVISNLTVCDVCVFHSGAVVSCVIFSKVPLMKPVPVVDGSKPNCDIMRGWASAYKAAVRQRRVRH